MLGQRLPVYPIGAYAGLSSWCCIWYTWHPGQVEDAPGSHAWYAMVSPNPRRPTAAYGDTRSAAPGRDGVQLVLPACQHHAHRAVRRQVSSQLGQHVLPIVPVLGGPRPALLWRLSSPFASCRSPPRANIHSACLIPLSERSSPGCSVALRLSYPPHDLEARSLLPHLSPAPLTRSPAAPCSLPPMPCVAVLTLVPPLAGCPLLHFFSSYLY